MAAKEDRDELQSDLLRAYRIKDQAAREDAVAIAEAAIEISRLRAALQVYADKANWVRREGDDYDWWVWAGDADVPATVACEALGEAKG